MFRRSGPLKRTSWQYGGYTAGISDIDQARTLEGPSDPTLNVSIGPQHKK